MKAYPMPLSKLTGKKILIVYKKGRLSREPSYIEDSLLEIIGGRIFLVGKGLHVGLGLPWHGLGILISRDSVSSFVAFDSREYFIQRHT